MTEAPELSVKVSADSIAAGCIGDRLPSLSEVQDQNKACFSTVLLVAAVKNEEGRGVSFYPPELNAIIAKLFIDA